MRRRSFALLVAACIACAGDSPTDPAKPTTPTAPPQPPAPLQLGAIAFTTSLPSSARVGATIEVALRATATTGAPMPNQSVTLAVTEGGGVLASSTVTTDAAGTARTSWTMGIRPGINRVTASAGTVTATAFLISDVDVPAKIVLAAALFSSVPSRTPFPAAPLMYVVDRFENRSSANDVTITAQLTSGGGTLMGETTTVTSSGTAQFRTLAIAGAVGPKTLTFSAPGLVPATGSTVLTAGPVSTASINEGNGQTAGAMTTLPVNPSVRVIDVDGNPVPGTRVTFAVASGGGTVGSTTVFTNSSGIASAAWVLGPTVGEQTLTATVAGLSSAITFVATAREPPCPASALLVHITTAGVIRASQCAIRNPYAYGGTRRFLGPEPDGVHFYNLYYVDLPAGAIARVEVTSSSDFPLRALAFEVDGTLVTEGLYTILLNNSTGASTRRLQVMIVPMYQGATGPYTVLARRL